MYGRPATSKNHISLDSQMRMLYHDLNYIHVGNEIYVCTLEIVIYIYVICMCLCVSGCCMWNIALYN